MRKLRPGQGYMPDQGFRAQEWKTWCSVPVLPAYKLPYKNHKGNGFMIIIVTNSCVGLWTMERKYKKYECKM